MATRKKLATVSSKSWTLDLAPGWVAEPEEQCVTITHPDGVGALQVSAHRRKGSPLSREDILEATELEPEALKHLAEQKWGAFRGFQLVYSDGEAFWRKWWLANGNVLLFVTYNCEMAHEDDELGAVNAMVQSLRSVRGSRRG